MLLSPDCRRALIYWSLSARLISSALLSRVAVALTCWYQHCYCVCAAVARDILDQTLFRRTICSATIENKSHTGLVDRFLVRKPQAKYGLPHGRWMRWGIGIRCRYFRTWYYIYGHQWCEKYSNQSTLYLLVYSACWMRWLSPYEACYSNG